MKERLFRGKKLVHEQPKFYVLSIFYFVHIQLAFVKGVLVDEGSNLMFRSTIEVTESKVNGAERRPKGEPNQGRIDHVI